MFDIPKMKEMRLQEDKEASIINIQICKMPLQIHPKIKVTVNHSMDWKTFAMLMESFHKDYPSQKIIGINRLMERKEAEK